MPRANRIDVGGVVYHVLNRANGRLPIFKTDDEFRSFERLLMEVKQEVVDMRICSYCIMPNHFHLVLYPVCDGDLSKFMSRLSQRHTQRWHIKNDDVGTGHLYQGRFKSFPVESDTHFLTVCRYVERNALRAKLVGNAVDWEWSSLWRRERGLPEQKKLLSDWPVSRPEDYLSWVNEPQTLEELDEVRSALSKDMPYGSELWRKRWVSDSNHARNKKV